MATPGGAAVQGPVIDHNLPGFSGLEALALGEEAAVTAMKAGARDFILKDNLSRFVPAVEREFS